ncbi:MAG: DUF2461 domain-containing protein [Vicingaceae bacterium]
MSHISKVTFDFLNQLKNNNNRDWFQDNKKTYEASHKEMIAFADALLLKLNEFDKIETVTGKKSLFRIYRDVRFSKNKLPYKTNRSGSFKRAGADRRGGIYFSIEPGNTVIGGGFYQPNKDDLNLIRQQIEVDASPLKEVLNSKSFKNYYGNLLGEKLKTSPRGYDIDHPEIELLRFKNFYVMHSFSDKEVLTDNFVDQVIDGYKKLMPFFDAMSLYLTTDLNGASTID